MSLTPARDRRLAASSIGLALLATLLSARNVAASETASLNQAVVEIEAFVNPPDPTVPWQTLMIERRTGSGVIIDGKRILTAAHVVEHHARVTAQRFGTTRTVEARVAYVDYECDLALLTVSAEDFFDGVTPAGIGAMPRAGDRVEVYGFPIGGESLSVTAGIVSRVEIGVQADPGEEILFAQIDAAVNEGNSGGPVFAGGKLVGIASAMLEGAENVGYVVPVPVIRHFLTDIEDGRVDGFPELGVSWQPVTNKTLRQSLGLEPEETGGLVTRIDHGSTASGVLEVGDVVLAIDGQSVAEDLTLALPDIARIDARYVTSQKQPGETIKLRVLRKGERIEREAVLKNVPPLVPATEHGPRSYYVFAGLVFHPLTNDYIESYEAAPSEFSSYYLDRNLRTTERDQVIVIGSVLPAGVNRGYDDYVDQVVATVDGRTPRDLRELSEMLDSAAVPTVTITTERGTRIVLDVEKARRGEKRILERYGIMRAKSQDLSPTTEKQRVAKTKR